MTAGRYSFFWGADENEFFKIFIYFTEDGGEGERNPNKLPAEQEAQRGLHPTTLRPSPEPKPRV